MRAPIAPVTEGSAMRARSCGPPPRWGANTHNPRCWPGTGARSHRTRRGGTHPRTRDLRTAEHHCVAPRRRSAALLAIGLSERLGTDRNQDSLRPGATRPPPDLRRRRVTECRPPPHLVMLTNGSGHAAGVGEDGRSATAWLPRPPPTVAPDPVGRWTMPAAPE